MDAFFVNPPWGPFLESSLRTVTDEQNMKNEEKWAAEYDWVGLKTLFRMQIFCSTTSLFDFYYNAILLMSYITKHQLQPLYYLRSNCSTSVISHWINQKHVLCNGYGHGWTWANQETTSSGSLFTNKTLAFKTNSKIVSLQATWSSSRGQKTCITLSQSHGKCFRTAQLAQDQMPALKHRSQDMYK